MNFSGVPIGAYFTMSKGLLWCKVNKTEARDVWSNRIISVKPNVHCNVSAEELKNKGK